ncbi:dTDP-glucose 4,6-dehydratase [Nocardia mexicana]|uniref:dTDP-glucose 4,6-dehydratase n=2 Tax=Nocardia mexicana TaxID=279262 RepID=A0A370HE28_9NOCA|nr:dTDP-glucose 4,6-dehydratase [Nocardia mexicana]
MVEQLLRLPYVASITVLDCHTHTAAPQAIPASPYRVEVIDGNILNSVLLADLVDNCDAVIHLAAETFVDASIADDRKFIATNIEGTAALLRVLRHIGGERRFVHASTDEVFGESLDGPFTEASPYAPRNPYSATKAAADHLVRAYVNTYDLDATIVHFCNLYGPWQYPEKLIPVTVARLLRNEPAQIFGSGLQSRTFLHVVDAAVGLTAAMEHGRPGESYLVGGDTEWTTLEVVGRIQELMSVDRPIQFVADRPGCDQRYAIDTSKAQAELPWKPSIRFESGLASTVEWLTANDGWWVP